MRIIARKKAETVIATKGRVHLGAQLTVDIDFKRAVRLVGIDIHTDLNGIRRSLLPIFNAGLIGRYPILRRYLTGDVPGSLV